jgi:hypothetical protein
MHARPESERGMGMAKVVEADPRDVCSCDAPIECLREARWMDRRSIAVGEDELVRSEPPSPLEPLLFFCSLVLRQHSDGLGVERDHPSTPLALWRPNSYSVSDLDHTLDNRELLSLEIEVAPAETEHLASAHA